MRYHLTAEEFDKLWDFIGSNDCDIVFEQFKVEYSEHGNKNNPGYWGTLTGEQKHINWLLLQL